MVISCTTDSQCVEDFFRNHLRLIELHYDQSESVWSYPHPLEKITLPFLEKLSGCTEGVLRILGYNINPQNDLRCVKNYSFDASPDKLDVNKICVLGFDCLGALSNIYKYKNLKWLRINGKEAVLAEDGGDPRQLSPVGRHLLLVKLKLSH